MRRYLFHGFVFATLTLLTQVGGIVYVAAFGLCALVQRSGRWRRAGTVVALTLALYGVLSFVIVPGVAPLFGRVRIPCTMTTAVSCALTRNYAYPALLDLILDLDAAMADRYPGSHVTVLDANFPFFDGFPLVPHLSHDDGKKIDLAFFYMDAGSGAAISGGSPSPIGYFYFQQPRADDVQPCADRFTPLRWDFDWAQPRTSAWALDEERTRVMIEWLSARPEVKRLFVEPYLARRLDLANDKLRFQGCQAARHDDHLHVELR